VLDISAYEGTMDHDASHHAMLFVESLVDSMEVPNPCVVDVFGTPHGACGVVEFNAAWGSGLNGCSAKAVLPAIAAATCCPGNE
jgi:hypothetical protein